MTTIEREHVAPVVAPVTTSDVLNRAADLLEEQGWMRGVQGLPHRQWYAGRRPLVPLCYLGSIVQAGLDLGVGPKGGFYFWAANTVGEPWDAATRWNDARGRTREEVIARLREAADAA